MAELDETAVASSVVGVDAIKRADMRIEVVKREINLGALAGFDSRITDYAAYLVIAALDSYDEAALDEANRLGYYEGFEAGTKNGLRVAKNRASGG